MKSMNILKFALSALTILFGLLFHTTLLVHVQFLKQWKSKINGGDKQSSYKICKRIADENSLSNYTDDVNCEKILEGNFTESCKWSQYHEQPTVSDETMIKEFTDCQQWLTRRNYPTEPNSKEEAEFPLAFSISMHGNVEQMERLLRLIYWPQNLYCIHVDKRSSNFTHEAINRLSNCFPNVFVTKSEYVYWAGFGVLQSVLNCMSDTLTHFSEHKWRYFLNLAGQDFPLKTNLELVKIFTLLNGSNDVELNYELQFSRYWFSHRIMTDSDGRAVTHMPDFRKSKLPIPYGLKVYKGNLAASLSKPFVEFLITNAVATNFTYWLRDTDTADEHLWATVNHNRIPPSMDLAPGGYPAHCHDSDRTKLWISRFVRWRNDKLDCHGKYVRDVCILGTGDLSSLINRPELFVNKFYLNYQSKAFQCMEQWFMKKVSQNRVEIDADYYLSLDAVKYRTYINENTVSNLNDDGCPRFMVNTRNISKYELPTPLKKYIKGSIVSQFRV